MLTSYVYAMFLVVSMYSYTIIVVRIGLSPKRALVAPLVLGVFCLVAASHRFSRRRPSGHPPHPPVWARG